MRRTPAVALSALLIVALAGLAGCSSWFESPANPANDAIAVANVHLSKAAAAGTSVADTAGNLDSIPYTKAGAAQALKLTAKIADGLTVQKTELIAAQAAMDSIAAMDVSDELKQYAKLESTAIGSRVKAVDLGAQLYAQMGTLYTALSKGTTTPEESQKILDGVETIKRDLTAVSELAAQQSQAATDYFTAHKLGG